MSRVEWSRLSGDETEAVISVLLCREFPEATRVKPSQGDGGIDVFIPPFESATVHQIKGYTGNIDATRKGHIKDSWKTLMKYSKENSINLFAWRLVTPENPTKEQLQWFREELTAGASFPCVWLGLDYVDGLAAKYPNVIDYYLRDGKGRLEEVVARFLSLANLPNNVSSPASSQETLAELHAALNEFDPHFTYDFSVESLGQNGELPPLPDVPGTLFVARFHNSDRCITFRVKALFREATIERPIPGSMSFVAQEGTELAQEIEDWFKFGAPLNQVRAKDVRWDLPGGFAELVQSDEAIVSIPPAKLSPGTLRDLTARIFKQDGKAIEAIDLIVEEASTGIKKEGTRLVGHDKSCGVLRYELRFSFNDKIANINFSMEDLVGRAPADLLPVVRFLAEVRPPHLIRLFLRNGPAFGTAWEIPGEIIGVDSAQGWIEMCESLATIQEHVASRIVIPDLQILNQNTLNSWHLAAQLLRGETIQGVWSGDQVHLRPGAEPFKGVQAGLLYQSFEVHIGQMTHPLGSVVIQTSGIQVDNTRPPIQHDDHYDVWIVPSGDPQISMRMATAPESPELTSSGGD